MSMFESYPQQFGAYQLVEKIGQGGMAEIFRAQTYGPSGFAKEVAIKRILPSLAHNEDFITQFLDEARIAGSLNHPNIVQIYDVGQVGDDYYIAMEYIKGRHLGQVIRKAIDVTQYLPVPIAASIVNEIAKALSFAHLAKDPSGTPLNVVHRDISPQNVLIAFNGAVKLTDFGIAKAANRLYQTTAGVIKGKFSYLAPEQLTGAPASPGSDVFALGIVFWELLAGRRLFQANSDIKTIQLVQACKIPSLSRIRNDIPSSLEPILSKVLAPKPQNRYQQANELIYDLTNFINQQGTSASLHTIGNYMASLYPEESMTPSHATPATEADVPAISMQDLQQFHEDSATQQHQLENIPTQILPHESLGVGQDPTLPPDFGTGLDTNSSPTADFGLETYQGAAAGRPMYVYLLGLLLLGGLVGGGILFFMNQGSGTIEPTPVEKGSVKFDIEPPHARLILNGVTLKTVGKSRTIPNLIGGLRYQVVASAKGYQSQKRMFMARDGTTFSFRITLKPLPKQAPPKEPTPRKKPTKRRKKR